MSNLHEVIAALAEHLSRQPLIQYPWREDREPFRILLAEMMLVRTRADLVVEPYLSLTREYPQPESLADADPADVERILLPLGLPKRIPCFWKAARYILDNGEGLLPTERRALERIPGVGRYTAEAVQAFAFEQEIVPADVNILRWLARVTGFPMVNPTKGSRELRSLLPSLKPFAGRKAYKLLDFTRTVCRARKPKCSECPVSTLCEFGRAYPRN